MELETDRLKLRQWKDEDYSIFADLNEDLQVMEFFPNPLMRMESYKLADTIKGLIEKRGWGLWAVELKNTNEFIGFTGLHIPKPSLPFSPCVEVGWRLVKGAWGFGYATEAARASLKVAFEDLKLEEIIAYTALHNLRSQSVMRKLGMTNTDQNFDHPDLDPGHPLREQLLFKITKSEWQENS